MGRRITKIRRLNPRSSKDSFRLDVQDENRAAKGVLKYSYRGQRMKAAREDSASRPSSQSEALGSECMDDYVLLFDRQTSQFTLNPLADLYNFNLTRTPDESDPRVLSKKYGRIDPNVYEGNKAAKDTRQINGNRTPQSDFDDLFEENNVDGEFENSPDPHNPFDYRNYLNGLPEPIPQDDWSGASSPAVTPSQTAGRSPSVSRSQTTSNALQEPSSATSTHKTNLAHERPLRGAAPKKKSKKSESTARQARGNKSSPPPQIPSVQIRRASTKPAGSESKTNSKTSPSKEELHNDEDDEGLVIELDDDKPTRGRPTERRGDFDFPRVATPGAGPISLHSAAASRSVSPAFNARRPQPAEARRRVWEEAKFDSDSGDEDGDVEELNIGSPAYQSDEEKPDRRKSKSTKARTARRKHDEDERNGNAAEEDDEDGFAQAIQQAIENDKEGKGRNGERRQSQQFGAPEEEEESEEE